MTRHERKMLEVWKSEFEQNDVHMSQTLRIVWLNSLIVPPFTVRSKKTNYVIDQVELNAEVASIFFYEKGKMVNPYMQIDFIAENE